MATFVSALLQTSQDRGYRRTRAVAIFGISRCFVRVCGRPAEPVTEGPRCCKHGEIQSWAIVLCSPVIDCIGEGVSERQKHLAVQLLERHRQLLSEPREARA